MSENIFRSIKQKAKERKEYRAKVIKQQNKVIDRNKSLRERLKKLKLLAVEFETMFQDGKYPQYVQFVKDVQNSLNDIAESAILSGDDRAALIAMAKKEVLEQLRNYPIEIIKDLENVRKQIDT